MTKMKYPNGLSAAMQEADVGPTELARLLGESRQNITRWKNGERKLTPAKAKEIAPHLGKSASDLLLLTRNGSLVAETKQRDEAARVRRVPLLSWVSAGKLSGGELPANVRAEKRIPVADLARGEWIALRVQGDSMDRVAPHGSLIFVDIADKRLVEEGFYVFEEPTGDSTFKRYRGGRKPRLQPFSTNPDHETIPASDGISVIGRVRRIVLDL